MGAGSGLRAGTTTAYTPGLRGFGYHLCFFLSSMQTQVSYIRDLYRASRFAHRARHPFTLLFHLLLYLQVLPHPHLSIIMTQPWGGSKSVAKDADGMGAVMVEGVMVRGSWERRPRELGGGTGGGPWDGQEQQASLWRGKDSPRKG